jgi:hypothetical protein
VIQHVDFQRDYYLFHLVSHMSQSKILNYEKRGLRKRGQTTFSTFYRIALMLKKVVCPRFLFLFFWTPFSAAQYALGFMPLLAEIGALTTTAGKSVDSHRKVCRPATPLRLDPRRLLPSEYPRPAQ